MKLLALLTAVMLCTSCGVLPGEDRSFAVALGVDEHGGVWEACARVPTYQTGGGYLTLKARGKSLGEALALLNASSPMELHYGQLRLLLFGKGLAESAEFSSVLQLLVQRGEVRAQAALCITADNVSDVMDALEPATGSRLSKSLEVLLQTRERLGVLPGTTLSDWQRAGERQQCVVICAALEPSNGNEQAGMDTAAGIQAAGGAGKVQFSGGWMLGPDGQVRGKLTALEMQLLALLLGKLRQGTLALPEGTVTLLETSSAVRLEGDAVHCRIRVKCSATSFSKEGAQTVLGSHLQSLAGKLASANCDALGLGRQAMQSCPSITDWHALNWPEKYPALTWHFTAEIETEA